MRSPVERPGPVLRIRCRTGKQAEYLGIQHKDRLEETGYRFRRVRRQEPSIGRGDKSGRNHFPQYGPDFDLLDLGTGKSRVFEVTKFPENQREVKPARIDAAKFITTNRLSPSGERILLNARGDISGPCPWRRPRRMIGTQPDPHEWGLQTRSVMESK